MIQKTYYTRDYERWITPITKGNDTYCLVFGKTYQESRSRAQDLIKVIGLFDGI
jgi:hypothetical protein